MEEGTLDVVYQCYTVGIGPHHVVFGREGLGTVAQLVIGEDRFAEYRHDDSTAEKHLGFGVLVMFGETHQRGLGAEELKAKTTDAHFGM